MVSVPHLRIRGDGQELFHVLTSIYLPLTGLLLSTCSSCSTIPLPFIDLSFSHSSVPLPHTCPYPTHPFLSHSNVPLEPTCPSPLLTCPYPTHLSLSHPPVPLEPTCPSLTHSSLSPHSPAARAWPGSYTRSRPRRRATPCG